DLDLLVVLAVACRRPERLRFTYLDAQGNTTDRLVEPFRLVYTARQWYLVAFDTSRLDWRTFRVDRISDAKGTGIPFERDSEPDPAAPAARGVPLAAHPPQGGGAVAPPADETPRHIGPTVGVVESRDGDTTIVAIGGDIDWISAYVAGLPFRFEVLEPPEV